MSGIDTCKKGMCEIDKCKIGSVEWIHVKWDMWNRNMLPEMCAIDTCKMGSVQ